MAEQTGALRVLTEARPSHRLPWYLEVWVRLVREKPLGTFGGILVLILIVVAILAPYISPFDPVVNNAADRLKGTSAQYWMGTDNFGRDLLSRIIWGARISLTVSLGAVCIGTTSAVIIGIVTGYVGGRFDMIVQRLVDAWMAFPGLVILLTIMAVLGPKLENVILAIALGMIFGSSRVIRGATLSIKENLYVESARCVGAGNLRIILRHILPNVAAPIIIIATLGLGSAIMMEATLSFLGLGVPPPTPTWGQMLSGSGRRYMLSAPWMAIFPGVALSLAIFGFNMLGDALRDILDPRLRGT